MNHPNTKIQSHQNKYTPKAVKSTRRTADTSKEYLPSKRLGHDAELQRHYQAREEEKVRE